MSEQKRHKTHHLSIVIGQHTKTHTMHSASELFIYSSRTQFIWYHHGIKQCDPSQGLNQWYRTTLPRQSLPRESTCGNPSPHQKMTQIPKCFHTFHTKKSPDFAFALLQQDSWRTMAAIQGGHWLQIHRHLTAEPCVAKACPKQARYTRHFFEEQ